VQRVPGHARVNEGPQPVRGAAQLVVLLGRLDEGGEVQPAKALELLGLPGDAVELLQDFLEQLLALGLAQLWLFGSIDSGREQPRSLGVLVIVLAVVLDADGQGLELLLAGGGAVAQLLRDLANEVVHLFELHVGKLVSKGLLVVAGPRVVVLIVLQQLLELVVVDVLVFPRRVDALAQGSAELHGRTSPKDPDAAGNARGGRTAMAGQ
jgi:hypothetical protein